MDRPHRHIAIESAGDVTSVRLLNPRMSEKDILEMADELLGLANQGSRRKLVLALGPDKIECLYSVFLAKLVMLRRHLNNCQGKLKIAAAAPETIGVFKTCGLDTYFDFEPDVATAIAHFAE
jgi:hypothetical protein